MIKIKEEDIEMVKKKINANDLVMNQDADASKWAAAFMQMFGNDLRRIDEGIMLAWFSNAMMTMSDIVYHKKIKPTNIQLSIAINALRLFSNKEDVRLGMESEYNNAEIALRAIADVEKDKNI